MTTGTLMIDSALHPLLAERWSPRSFDPRQPIDDRTMAALLEAARWAPSAGNSQPWRFGVAYRGSPEFQALLDALMPGNQTWAGNAAVLLLVAAETVAGSGDRQPWALYDAGQAAAHLSVQAQAEGISVHQMGGFAPGEAADAFDLPAGVEPVVVMALGVRAEADSLPEPYFARELAPRTRLPLDELVLNSRSALSLSA